MEETQQHFFIKEYEKLKEEQHKRIEYRDHMIYLTLGAIGAVFSFSFEKPEMNIALLVLPFLCIVLGWTYLTNDEKISSIGIYIKTNLIPRILDQKNQDSRKVVSWEDYLKHDKSRKGRKLFQLIIDLSVFCFSALASIVAFYRLHHLINWYHIIISIAEVLVIAYMFFQFIKYSELFKK